MNFPFVCSNIPAAPAYGVYISPMIRYSRAFRSDQDFLDIGLLLTRKLLNQEFAFGKVEVITSKIVRSPPWLGWPLWNICVTNDNGYVPLVVNTSWSFPHSRLITVCVTRPVPLVEQELLTLPEHLSSPPGFSGVHVTRSLVLYLRFVYRCLYFFAWPLCCLFFFDIRIMIASLVSSNSSWCRLIMLWPALTFVLSPIDICVYCRFVMKLPVWFSIVGRVSEVNKVERGQIHYFFYFYIYIFSLQYFPLNSIEQLLDELFQLICCAFYCLRYIWEWKGTIPINCFKYEF
jgi:hypothetical protein